MEKVSEVGKVSGTLSYEWSCGGDELRDVAQLLRECCRVNYGFQFVRFHTGAQ